MPTYAVLLPGDEDQWEASSAEAQAATYAVHHAFSRALETRGHTVVGGAELAHSRAAKQVRTVEGRVVVTDGPYAETVEQLTGFYLVESDDLDDLVQVAAMLARDGAVEVRECLAGPEQSEEVSA